MKIGVQLHPQATTVDAMRAAWRAADELGVDSLWTWDHFYPLIDHISGGRFILGLGSGWFQRDYDEYGYEFGTVVGRLRALEAGLPAIKERLDKLNPGPVNGSMPLMIGGGGEKFTLRLVAEHADMSNVFGPAENARHKNQVIDQWCGKIGRDPAEIERTVLIKPEELAQADAYAEAGNDHLIVMTASPFDLDPVEKFLAGRG
jgi:alkanesulfonate monooxygenase SsuD/methylene tetrahydromethanopterin reductase-like flavin-dependent oxidoreductase (luciferase family)